MASTSSILIEALEHSHDLVFICKLSDNQTFEHTYVSASIETVLQHKRGMLLGCINEKKELFPESFFSSLPAITEKFCQMRQSSQSFHMQIRNELLHASGASLTFDTQITQHPSLSDHLLVVCRDVTELVRLEAEREAERKAEREADQVQLELFAMCDASFDLVAVIEVLNGTVWRRYSSRSHMTVLGHEPESCNGNVLQMEHLFQPDYLAVEMPLLVSLFETGGMEDGYTGEVMLLHAEGHPVPFEYRISKVKGKPQSLFVVCRDITERQRLQKLEMERQRLEVERCKDEEAVHTISHQLKNRFIALNGLVQSLHGSIKDHAAHLLRGPHNVQETLDDLMGQIRGGIRVCLNESIMRSIVHDTYTRTDTEFDLHTELYQLCGTRIALTIDLGVPQRIQSDLNLILNVVDNFTSNAAKYAPEEAHARLHVSALPSSRLLISVHNDPGAKHAELRSRFGNDASPLFQGGLSVHTDILSTRKGLAIAKNCAALLGGTVSIRFEETEVVASLTFRYSILPASLCLPTSTLIASLDDQAMIRKMDAVIIQQMDTDVESVQHIRGGTADEICAFPEYVMQMKRQPTIILIDQNLDHPIHRTPLIKGTELIPRLRGLGYKGKIVMKSANSAVCDIRSFIAAGADGAVAKGLSPIDMNRQLACILFGLTPEPDEPFDSGMIDMIPIRERREFVDMFVSEVQSLLKRMQDVVRGGIQQEIDSVLHALKGVSGNFGAVNVSHLCASLRGRAMEEHEWKEALQRLEAQLDQVFTLLESKCHE